MNNIIHFYYFFRSVVRLYVLSVALLLPLCCAAQEGTAVLKMRLNLGAVQSIQRNTRIDSLIRIARQYSNQDRTDTAKLLFKRAVILSELHYYPAGMAESQSCLGRIYLFENDLEQSKTYFHKAIDYLKQSGERPGLLANMYNTLATAYARQGKRDSALAYYHQSLKLAETLPEKDSLLLAIVYNNIVGGVLNGYAGYSGKKEQVMYYLNLAKPIAIDIGTKGTSILGNIYINTGLVHTQMDRDTASALVSYKSGINLLRKVNAKADLQLAYSLVAALYVDWKSYDAAKPYIDSAIAVDEKGFANNLQLNEILGSYLLHKKEYRQSFFYFNRAMEICNASGSSNFKLTLYYFRAQVYRKLGQGLKAYEDQKNHSDLLDSLMNKQRIEAVNAMETRYRTAEMDKKLAQGQLLQQKKEDRIKVRIIWIGATILTLIFALVFIISRQRNKQKLLIQQQEIALLSSRMQGEDLERSRIARELHDGVSILLSAAKMNFSAMGKENPELIQTESFQEVGVLLNQTVQEVRSISHNLVPGLLMHQSLPAAVQAFCELIGKGYNLSVELLVYGPFTNSNIEWNYSVYRMIQELVHNVIKHAKASDVLIQMTMHDDKLHLTVEDNGIGFVEGKSTVLGIGLQGLRQRVEHMHGQFIFSSTPSVGTTVEIEIPLTDS